jgi:tetratricopeptide (TPR) repeat protein
MTNASLTLLDQDELFQAALQASGDGDSDTAIACLNEAVTRPDAGAAAHYLLGAEYAQVQHYERAIEAMEFALALDAELHMARLQLALLYLGRNDSERAAAALTVLAQLDEQEPLRHFAGGLLHLIQDECEAALAALEKGIGLNSSAPALNADMRLIMREIGAPTPTPTPAADEHLQHVLLSAYTVNRMQ